MLNLIQRDSVHKWNHLVRQLVASAESLMREAIRTSYDLFKITVPISIVTKLLNEAGIVTYLGGVFRPIMELTGLPGDMGLVLATTMLTNLYGGIVMFTSLEPAAHLTVAQVTVLATMMLISHSLPIELRIVQKAGVRLRAMAILRIGAALVVGWMLHQIYGHGAFLQQPSILLWSPQTQDPSWLAWVQSEINNLFTMFLIILALLFLLKMLKHLGVTALLTRLLAPFLAALGMSEAAAPITIIGMTMGLSFGGGLIIQETGSGKLEKHDIFSSLALMSLCHGLIDDTLLMIVLGGHQSGILWGRLLFSFLTIFLLVKLLRRIPDETLDQFLFRIPDGSRQKA